MPNITLDSKPVIGIKPHFGLTASVSDSSAVSYMVFAFLWIGPLLFHPF